MDKGKETSRQGRLSAQEKANLRAGLSDLLERAVSSPEAAQEALRACLKLRRSAPSALLTRDNIASSLSLREVTRSLDRLSASEMSLDISAGLAAIKVLAVDQLKEPVSRRLLSNVTKAVTSKLTKMSEGIVRTRKKVGPKGNQPLTKIKFTDSTLSSAADLALWMLSKTFEERYGSGRSAYPLAIRWVGVVESIWRRSSSRSAVSCAVEFLRSLERVLSTPVYAGLKAEPSVANFIQDTDSALVQEAANALIDGRLKDLERILALVLPSENGDKRLLSHLRDICQSRPSDVLPEAVEWVARHVETPSSRLKSPIAVDESQSSALDYVSVCLLTAWDAALEGGRSTSVLENIRRLARELFKVDLTGTPGEVVIYDELQHELRPQEAPIPKQVEIVRPGVRWSDGIRTRFLVRTVVKPTSHRS